MAKKKKEIVSADVDLRKIILQNKVPLLTLDERWHALFPDEKKTQRIKTLEKRLNDLVKNQGKLGTDITELKNLKKKLMNEVISSMGESSGISARIKEKKQDKLQKLILEVNEKIKNAESSNYDCPEQIQQANVDLLMECMREWLIRMDTNNEEIEKISGWVERVREETKEKLLVKQDKEMENNTIYSYMHSLLGAKTMEHIDSREQ